MVSLMLNTELYTNLSLWYSAIRNFVKEYLKWRYSFINDDKKLSIMSWENRKIHVRTRIIWMFWKPLLSYGIGIQATPKEAEIW